MVMRFVLFPAMLLGFGAASVWSVRLACADYWFRQGTVGGTEKAIRFTPGQADYYIRLALLEPDENSPKATEALKRAVALNPSDSRSWIELGLRYEKEGNRPLAEQYLLRAAEEDKQYLPRWTLANFYFRGNEDRFWFWSKEAARMAYGDPSPLFRLCGRVAEDGALIDRLDIGRPEVRAAYLAYLLGQNRLDLIRPASRHLLTGTRSSDVPLLLNACDRLLESKNVLDALEIWNGLADNHGIPFERLQPADGRVLTNGGFLIPPTRQGFDWRLPAIDGVSASADEGGGLRLTFSGSQPENCEPLVQFVPVQENMDYKLKFANKTYGMPAVSGLEWRITELSGGRALVAGDILSAEREQARTALLCDASRLSFCTSDPRVQTCPGDDARCRVCGSAEGRVGSPARRPWHTQSIGIRSTEIWATLNQTARTRSWWDHSAGLRRPASRPRCAIEQAPRNLPRWVRRGHGSDSRGKPGTTLTRRHIVALPAACASRF